jgi:membrane protein DedA with SNARE-associated domain
LGIPFPVSLIVIAAGAFARQGVIDWRLGFLACTVGSVLADSSEYALGWWAAVWLERRFGQRGLWKTAQANFDRQGGWAILLTRFWLITLAPVVNLIAADRFTYARFFLYDFCGEFIWVLIYGGLGYLFADEWPLISQVISDFTGLSIGVVALGVGIYLFIRWRRKNRVR